MTKKNRFRYFARAVLLLLIIAEMTAIFVLSAQPAGESAQTSGGIIVTIARFFNKDFDSLDEQQQQAIIDRYQNLIRKAAHMAEYGLLGGMMALFAFTFESAGLVARLALPVIISVLYAASDELHQYFVPGRGPGVKDVLIDGAGAVICVAALNLIYRLCACIRERKESGK